MGGVCAARVTDGAPLRNKRELLARSPMLKAPLLTMRHRVDSTPSVMDKLSGVTQQPDYSKTPAADGFMIPHEAPHLTRLPEDVLLLICSSSCSATDLLAASCASKALRAVIDNGQVLWEKVLLDRHGKVINALFQGTVPKPIPHSSWKCHVFGFDRDWLGMARRKSGRILLRMRSDCAGRGSDHDFGIPPRRAHLLTVRVPWLEIGIPITVELFGLGKTFGIYDVTDFVAVHPGADQILLDAAQEDDCTDSFDASNHTERARSILRTLVVPGLEALLPLKPLARARPTPVIRVAIAMYIWLRALPVLLWSAVCHRAYGMWDAMAID